MAAASSRAPTMLLQMLLLHALLLLVITVHSAQAKTKSSKGTGTVLSRSSFPKGTVFGAASSAYQYEGATMEDGRKQSNWDFYAKIPGKIGDGSTADVALDQYHRYKEDINLLASLGADAYRFSIGWTRMFPDGTGKVNPKAVAHYNKVIDYIIAKGRSPVCKLTLEFVFLLNLLAGLKPYVTLFHWDVPLALDKGYGGFLNKQIVHDFGRFAEACFENFGDRVKNWITLNEPHIFCITGYTIGVFAPGRCSPEIGNCTGGDSSTEPYIVGHHLLLSHAKAVSIYNKKYRASQKGVIGLTLDSLWYFPHSNSKKDKIAADKAIQFNLGWMLHPVTYGEYPPVMISNVGDRLPKFTAEEKRALKGSLDFVGLNHYTTVYAGDLNGSSSSSNLLTAKQALYHPAYYKDEDFALYDRRNKKLIGTQVGVFFVVPRGFRAILNYIRKNYKNPVIYITENGIGDTTSEKAPLKQQLNDQLRIVYYSSYLSNMAAAVRDGCRVQAYFLWSFLDNWEWASGFAPRMGIIHIDYKHNLKRIPKKSAAWYAKFLKGE